jgi:hypothetical protein
MGWSVGCISVNEDGNLWFAVSLFLLLFESWAFRLYGTWLRVSGRSRKWRDSIGRVAGGANREWSDASKLEEKLIDVVGHIDGVFELLWRCHQLQYLFCRRLQD